MNLLENLESCAGCTACYNICPRNAISLKENMAGFFYPHIDSSKCIHCNQCRKVCPLDVKNNVCEQTVYMCQSKDNSTLYTVASGGVFFEIAKSIVKEGGVAVGAKFEEDFRISHTICRNIKDLEKLKGSKYVQSELGTIFKEIKTLLENDIKVCFSGTPCQVAGLKMFLGKDYCNLYTIDFLCHSVGAPKAFKVYLSKREQELGKISYVKFKSKKYGYSFPTLELGYVKNGKEKSKNYSSQSDPFMKMFLSGSVSRKSCYNCKFRNNHFSDITLADYYGKIDSLRDFNNNGICRVFCNSEKAVNIIKRQEDNLRIKKVKKEDFFEKMDSKNYYETQIPFEELDVIGESKFYSLYYKVGYKDKIVAKVRFILYRLGIQDFVKQFLRGVRN